MCQFLVAAITNQHEFTGLKTAYIDYLIVLTVFLYAKIKLLEPLGQSSFPCHFYILGYTCILCFVESSSNFKAINEVTLTSAMAVMSPSPTFFKGSCDYLRHFQITQDNLNILNLITSVKSLNHGSILTGLVIRTQVSLGSHYSAYPHIPSVVCE